MLTKKLFFWSMGFVFVFVNCLSSTIASNTVGQYDKGSSFVSLDIKTDRNTNLAGNDKNNNGVRDDVENWLIANYSKKVNPIQYESLWQLALSLQAIMIADFDDKDVFSKMNKQYQQAEYCFRSAFLQQSDVDKNLLIGFLEGVYANTVVRNAQFYKYKNLLLKSKIDGVKEVVLDVTGC